MTDKTGTDLSLPAVGSVIHVVSYIYWNGTEVGGGGFWWYHTEADALLAFEKEKRAWQGSTARVRLLPVIVTKDMTRCTGHWSWSTTSPMSKTNLPCWADSPVTCWLELNMPEVSLDHAWPASRVWIGTGQD